LLQRHRLRHLLLLLRHLLLRHLLLRLQRHLRLLLHLRLMHL
jgi:hypothetical protein